MGCRAPIIEHTSAKKYIGLRSSSKRGIIYSDTSLLPYFSAPLAKVAGWAEQLTGLGDRLSETDEVPAAHALFLVAGRQVELPTTKGARLVLPGVDHRNPAHR